MKRLALFIAILLSTTVIAQNAPIPSKVFVWDNESPSSKQRNLFNGSGAILARHGVYGIEVEKGKTIIYSHKSTESFFIVKQGPITARLNGNFAVLDRGSVISLMPGDELFIKNTGDNTAQLYEMLYESKSPPDVERAKKAGGSFFLNWKDVAFKTTEKGGVRQFFDRQTVMLNRFDIHVTQLNEGLKSHDPHTHTNEEIILMLDGNAEMQIGTEHQKANPGDVVFLNSMVLHNLTNVGKTPCLYFAIQWN